MPGAALLLFFSSCVISYVFMYYHGYGSVHQVVAAWQEGLLELKLSDSVFAWGFLKLWRLEFHSVFEAELLAPYVLSMTRLFMHC